MFILSDGEGKTGTVELMEPVGLSSHSVHIGIVSSCFDLLLMFLIWGMVY